MISKVQSTKGKIEKLELLAITNMVLDSHSKRIRIEATDWENILANQISDEELINRIYKDVSKHKSKKDTPNNSFRQLKKRQNILSKRIYRCKEKMFLSLGKYKFKLQ